MDNAYKYNIKPVETKISPYIDEDSMICGWNVKVVFQGDIQSLFKQPDLMQKYDLSPDGSELSCRMGYDSIKNTTVANFLFKLDSLPGQARRRALNFKNKIQSQISASKRNENTK